MSAHDTFHNHSMAGSAHQDRQQQRPALLPSPRLDSFPPTSLDVSVGASVCYEAQHDYSPTAKQSSLRRTLPPTHTQTPPLPQTPHTPPTPQPASAQAQAPPAPSAPAPPATPEDHHQPAPSPPAAALASAAVLERTDKTDHLARPPAPSVLFPPPRFLQESAGNTTTTSRRSSAESAAPVMEQHREGPALHVIVLGSGGGPLENNCTAFLVRSVAAGWSKGSIAAVDAGVHLSAIANILYETQPYGLGKDIPLPHKLTSGPFAGLELPFASPGANAAYIGRDLIDTYLITHPHLDHISGFVINTAAQPGTRPKKLAGLPSTINAFKTHIFNNVIWPNLSDENNGAGLVTYMRLVEGGSPALGDGETKGYTEVCEGLAVKVWGVSHGHCMEKHSHRGSVCSSMATPQFPSFDSTNMFTPRVRRTTHLSVPGTPPGPTTMPRLGSMAAGVGLAGLPVAALPVPVSETEKMCVTDSSAYFLRDAPSGREILIFGDVEPDSISLTPRTYVIWKEAAPKIAAGNLAAIMIECSFDNSQSNDRLYGHLKPDFIMEELWALGSEVEAVRSAERAGASKKRKLSYDADSDTGNENGGIDGVVTRDGIRRRTVRTRANSGAHDDPVSPKTVKPLSRTPLASDDYMIPPSQPSPHLSGVTSLLTLEAPPTPPSRQFNGKPLKGLKVVIIHVKDKLWDGPDAGETIMQELLAAEAEMQTGVEFILSHVGQSLYL